MQKYNNSSVNDDLWLECEKIQQSISLVLEKLHQISEGEGEDTDIDFTSLLADIQQKLDAQTSSLSQVIDNSNNAISSVITNRIATECANVNSSLTNHINTKTASLQTSLTALSETLTQLSTTASQTNQNSSSLLTDIQNVQAAISSALNAILQAIANISGGGEASPFVLDFDEVYATSSTYYSPRSHYSSRPVLTLPKEPFVINYNTPAYMLVEFDLTLSDNANVEVCYNLNSSPILTKNITLLQGESHIEHQFALNGLNSSDNDISITFTTQNSSCVKTVKNLKYSLIGNNALFLRENAQNIYSCFPVNNQIYLTKRNKNVCEYKILDMQNLDFSGNYSILANLDATSTVYPSLVLTCSQTEATVNQLVYAQISEVTNKFTTHNSDGSVQRTLDMTYNAEIAREVGFYPYYDSTYTAQFVFLFQNQKRMRRYRSYNIVRSSTMSQNFTNNLVPLQVQFPILCTIKNGYGSTGLSDYIIYQTTHGDWYVNTIGKLAQGTQGFWLGFGSRATFAICPPLSQNDNEDYIYMRAFIKAYSNWYVYYFYVDKNDGSFHTLKTERINTNYDQVIAGNANLYFGLLNGSITPIYDATFKSITEI